MKQSFNKIYALLILPLKFKEFQHILRYLFYLIILLGYFISFLEIHIFFRRKKILKLYCCYQKHMKICANETLFWYRKCITTIGIQVNWTYFNTTTGTLYFIIVIIPQKSLAAQLLWNHTQHKRSGTTLIHNFIIISSCRVCPLVFTKHLCLKLKIKFLKF